VDFIYCVFNLTDITWSDHFNMKS